MVDKHLLLIFPSCRKLCPLPNPILDTRISVCRLSFPVTLRVLPLLKSGTWWTGELWSKRVLLILEY